MEQLLQELKGDLAGFREMTKKFYAGEVSQKEYKGFSGGFGSYAQRGGKVSMLRLRLREAPKGKVKIRGGYHRAISGETGAFYHMPDHPAPRSQRTGCLRDHGKSI